MLNRMVFCSIVFKLTGVRLCRETIYGHLPFCKHFVTSGLGYDCTRIFGLLIELLYSGHNGLFARLLLIALTCSRHSGFVRFCKRRFDLFSISYLCYTIVAGRFLSLNLLEFEGLPSNSSRFALRQEIGFLS